MKIELIIFIITAILIANTYYDGKLVKLFNMIKHSKYLKMITFGFAGLSIYLFLKKNPKNSKEFLGQANDMIKTLPMTRDSASLITPFLSLSLSRIKHSGITYPHCLIVLEQSASNNITTSDIRDS